MKNIQLIKIVLNPTQFFPADIPRLRAFLAHEFQKYEELHNHTADGGFRYVYPEIQFKLIEKKPTIIGFRRGAEALVQIFHDVQFIELNHKRIEVPEKSIQLLTVQVGLNGNFHRYRFATPWMALNQENYVEYKKLNPFEKEQKLNRILWGNLRTMAHAFDDWIEDQDAMKVSGHFTAHMIKFKGNTMLAFKGDFITNYIIPQDLGIGKQVARGFGVVNRN
jgi:hypothetical protein